MNVNILNEYKNNCNSLLYLKDDKKEICEKMIKMILIDQKNFEMIKFILLEEEDIQLKLITIESIKKAFQSLDKTKNYIITHEGNTEERIEEENTIDYLKHINSFFFEYLIKIDLTKIPKFIINSIANCFAENIKIFFSRGISIDDIKNAIKSEISTSNKIEIIYIIILLFDFLISNLLINPSEYAYIQYKKMILNFKADFLIDILKACHNTIKTILSSTNFNELKYLEVLNLSLDVYFKCLTFPYNISYNGYNCDTNLEEITLTLFPKEFVDCFIDFYFFDLLFKLLESKLSPEISLKITRILSRITSTRCSIFPNDIVQTTFREKCVQGFILVIEYSFLDTEMLNEIIEYLSRLITLFGISFILNCKEIYQNFENKTELLSNQIIRNSLKLEDSIFYKLTYYWKKIKPNYNSLNSEKKILDFLVHYCDFFFLENQNIVFFNDKIKSSKNFEKLVELRFLDMKDLFHLDKISIFSLIQKVFESLTSFSNNLEQKNINVFLTRFGHFLILFTFCILKPDSYYSHHHFALESEIEELEFLEKIAFMCIEIFWICSRIEVFINFTKIEIYRGFKMSFNFYLSQLGLVVIDKLVYKQDLDCLYYQKENLGTYIINNPIFENAENFLIQICQKLLFNFEFQDKIIIQHSLKVLRELSEKIKKVYKGKKRKILLLEQICTNLIKSTNKFLTPIKFYKLRMSVYEIIGISYLDDYHDNYIENSHMIISQIIANNTENNVINLKRIFYDVLGIYKATYLSKITITFTKISYPKIQNLLQTYGDELLSDNTFIAILIEFYKVLMENTSTKYSVNQSQVIMFTIITDSCRMVSLLLKQINEVLKSFNIFDKKLEFITNNHKLVKRFLQIFDVLIKYSDVSFSIFHFFGNDLFIDFIKNIYKFIFLISDCIFANFPKEKKKITDVLLESSDNLSDLIVEYFDENQIDELLNFILNFFNINFDTLNENSNSEAEQVLFESISNIIKHLLNSIYEYLKIYINDNKKFTRIKNIIQFTYPTAKKFALKIIGINILYPYLIKNSNNFSSMVFYIAIVYKENGLFENFVQEISKECFFSENYINNDVLNTINLLQDNIEFNLVKTNLETFQTNYNNFIENLLKIFKHENQRKNSFNYNDID